MKKLMIATLAAVALVGAAQAAKSYDFSVDSAVAPYEAIDTAPGDSKFSYYKLYVMMQSDAQAAMRVSTSVSYGDVADWLGKNFAVNRKAVIENAQAVSASEYWNQYFFEVMGVHSDEELLGNAIGVYLYDDGVNFAYDVFSNAYSDEFIFASNFGSASTGWTVASVPEPTSGLLLLLGIAGLALKRKQK